MPLHDDVSDLQPHGVLVFPLHVVDVPGHPGHGVERLLHHVVALLLSPKVLRDLLNTSSKTEKIRKHLFLRRLWFSVATSTI